MSKFKILFISIVTYLFITYMQKIFMLGEFFTYPSFKFEIREYLLFTIYLVVLSSINYGSIYEDINEYGYLEIYMKKSKGFWINKRIINNFFNLLIFNGFFFLNIVLNNIGFNLLLFIILFIILYTIVQIFFEITVGISLSYLIINLIPLIILIISSIVYDDIYGKIVLFFPINYTIYSRTVHLPNIIGFLLYITLIFFMYIITITLFKRKDLI